MEVIRDDTSFAGVCDIFPLREISAFDFPVFFQPDLALSLIPGARRPVGTWDRRSEPQDPPRSALHHLQARPCGDTALLGCHLQQ